MAMRETKRLPNDENNRSESDAYLTNESTKSSVFRNLFNYYKRNDPPPDLSKVINMKKPKDASGIRCVPFSSWKDKFEVKDLSQYTDLGLR